MINLFQLICLCKSFKFTNGINIFYDSNKSMHIDSVFHYLIKQLTFLSTKNIGPLSLFMLS